jgi:putative transcriptional regulator
MRRDGDSMTTSFKGRLLVASPSLEDPNFDRTVVLMLDHDEGGALGVVVNRPGELTVADALPHWTELAAEPAVVFSGGPVAPEAAFCLGRVDLPSEDGAWTAVLGQLGVLDVTRLPDDVGQRVREVRIFSGCAGWSPGQLEDEIAAGAWYVVEASQDDALSTQPLELWQRVLRRQGGRLALVSAFPANPSLN